MFHVFTAFLIANFSTDEVNSLEIEKRIQMRDLNIFFILQGLVLHSDFMMKLKTIQHSSLDLSFLMIFVMCYFNTAQVIEKLHQNELIAISIISG